LIKNTAHTAATFWPEQNRNVLGVGIALSADDSWRAWKIKFRAVAALLETVTAENQEQVMFSQAAAGSLTALQMLEIDEAHLQTHRRQIDRIRAGLPAKWSMALQTTYRHYALLRL
jgi:hypothetical protein